MERKTLGCMVSLPTNWAMVSTHRNDTLVVHHGSGYFAGFHVGSFDDILPDCRITSGFEVEADGDSGKRTDRLLHYQDYVMIAHSSSVLNIMCT